MQRVTHMPASQPGGGLNAGRFFTALAIFVVTVLVLWQGFFFLRDAAISNIVRAMLAIVWGVGGTAMLYFSLNGLVESLPDKLRGFLQPFVFVGPALLILTWFFVIPTIRTGILSFYDSNSENFVGLDNYAFVLSDRQMLTSFRNNMLWMVLGTCFCVALGLLIAVFADRSKFDRVAKSIIFMPMAISFVGAAVIWRFVYYYQPPGSDQIGLLNAFITALGGQPRAFMIENFNNIFLIVIMIWMQTGFAMVIFSAALKGVPDELLEAGRIDGASEKRVFFSIMIPAIKGTIITVTTTILIFCLKIFDIVIAMTGGQYDTEVIATQFYRQYFANRNFGYGSAIAIVLLVAVIPVMIYNLRQLGEQKGFKG
jgi:alpha-glucoside transport system permease protein